VSVCGTDTSISCNEAFLDGIGSAKFPRAEARKFSILSAHSAITDLPIIAWPTGQNARCPIRTLRLPFRVPPLLYNKIVAVREY
jgi:hypothetical protein